MKRIFSIIVSVFVTAALCWQAEAQVNRSQPSKTRQQKEAQYQREKQRREAEYQKQKQQKQVQAQRARQQAAAGQRKARHQAEVTEQAAAVDSAVIKEDERIARLVENEAKAKVEEVKPQEPKNEQIFTAVEESPKFPGGDKAMYEFLSKNIRYPEMAAQNNIQGRVTTQFVVEKDGSIGEVKVVRGKDPDLDKEAVRVVKSMPKFIPGKMNDKAVRVWYTLPINFKLQSGEVD
ncbi:MAG: energy transducer TonB [Muribaculaceae bacterium]|nr:energy transducer TonB [Muribaculaceae bacterium]